MRDANQKRPSAGVEGRTSSPANAAAPALPPRRPVTVAVVLGTRPEAIKLAPLVLALQRDPGFLPCVLHTGQHAGLAADVLDAFDITPQVRLDLLRPGQGLTELLGRAVVEIGSALETTRPDVVVVQGDTTTAAAAALASAQHAIPVVHVEAGLRSGDRSAPFPEEDNRRVIGAVASLHLAPTPAARDNLRREGVDPAAIVVTGNTGIDALDAVLQMAPPNADPVMQRVAAHDGHIMLVTTHRRESWGQDMEHVAGAIREIVVTEPSLLVVLPMHPNPTVRDVLRGTLDGHERIVLCEPLGYASLAQVLASSTLVLTDSGGIQEEAPRLGVPVLVLRRTTERPEGVAAGAARLVGVDRERVISGVRSLLHDRALRRTMSRPRDIYGDGQASSRALAAIGHHFGLDGRPDDFVPTLEPRPRHAARHTPAVSDPRRSDELMAVTANNSVYRRRQPPIA